MFSFFLACSHMEEPLGHAINEEAMEDRPLIPFPGRPQGYQTHEHRKSNGRWHAGGRSRGSVQWGFSLEKYVIELVRVAALFCGCV